MTGPHCVCLGLGNSTLAVAKFGFAISLGPLGINNGQTCCGRTLPVSRKTIFVLLLQSMYMLEKGTQHVLSWRMRIQVCLSTVLVRSFLTAFVSFLSTSCCAKGNSITQGSLGIFNSVSIFHYVHVHLSYKVTNNKERIFALPKEIRL